MNIINKSYFKDATKANLWWNEWIAKIEFYNKRKYQNIVLETSLGKTQIYALRHEQSTLEAIVIFPGARTSALFWDLDGQLSYFNNYRIYLVETNGLPNMSDGNSPDFQTINHGIWADEVCELLDLKGVYCLGASFGAQIAIKLALFHSKRVKQLYLLNPGCFQKFSLKPKNIYYNLLPIFFPNRKNVQKFLDKAIFYKPNHQLSETAEELLLEYELFVLKNHKDNMQKPYMMTHELGLVLPPVYLILGTKDLLFPYQKNIDQAKKYLPNLQEIKLYDKVGHGIETYAKVFKYIAKKITKNVGENGNLEQN